MDGYAAIAKQPPAPRARPARGLAAAAASLVALGATSALVASRPRALLYAAPRKVQVRAFADAL